MNENIETLNMEANETPIVNDFEAADFSDDFFEVKEMDTLPEEQWHTDDNIVLNFAPEIDEIPEIQTLEEPVVVDEKFELPTFEDEFLSINVDETEENSASDFDAYFDSLYDDVEGANNLISEIIEKKKSIKENEENINQIKESLAKDKIEFEKFMESQKESLELERKQFEEYMKNQKNRLEEEEQEIKSDAEVKNRELQLKEDAMKIEREKLDADKEQFNKYKETEESKLSFEREKISNEQAQLEKDTLLSLQTIQNERKDLETEKEHFAQQKEAEEKKIAFEKENLAQSCAKFKQLVSQFNSSFAKLPEDK